MSIQSTSPNVATHAAPTPAAVAVVEPQKVSALSRTVAYAKGMSAAAITSLVPFGVLMKNLNVPCTDVILLGNKDDFFREGLCGNRVKGLAIGAWLYAAGTAFHLATGQKKDSSSIARVFNATIAGAYSGAVVGYMMGGSTTMSLPTEIRPQVYCWGRICQDPIVYQNSTMPNYIAGAIVGGLTGAAMEIGAQIYNAATRA